MKDLNLNNHKTTYNDLLMIFLLFSSIFLQRLAFPLVNSQIAIALPILLMVTILYLFNNRFNISLIRVVIFTLFTVVILFLTFFHKLISYNSIFYLIILYLPFLIDMNYKIHSKLNYMLKLQTMIMITAIIGILQFIFQLTGLGFFDPLTLLPENFLQQGYLTTYSISYGSDIMKSNGAFYLEPSLFSQFLAISIVIELILFKRWIRIGILAVALLFTFSGTGLMLLAFFLIPIIFTLKPKQTILILLLGFSVGFIFFTSEYGANTLVRTQEYKSSTSSFSIRFINPFNAVVDSENSKIIFGHGAGSSDSTIYNYPTNFTVIPKLWYEYGFVPMILFLFFICNFLIKNKNKLLSFSILFMYLFLSGSLLQPQTIIFIFIMGNILEIDKNYLLTKGSKKDGFKMKKTFSSIDYY